MKDYFFNNIVEMQPGEGKTTISRVAGIVYALLGFDVYLIN
jgi:preprotein translocase subunit SecA